MATKLRDPENKIKHLDVDKIRQDFPVLQQTVHGKPLVYLDNAATTQKPKVVIDAITQYYENTNANVHRGIHTLSEQATHAYEMTRQKVKTFLNARSQEEIVFVRGTTEAINLVAQSFTKPRLQAGDEIVITEMEHHSNIVPWHLICEATQAKLIVVPITDSGEIELTAFENTLTARTKMVALGHASNALGSINPIKHMIELAHARNIPVLIDGAQGVPHGCVDVQALDCDFYAFSSHKVYGPTGVGVLYAKAQCLDAMPPYQGGGDMIRKVSFTSGIEYHDVPHKFEAGTPHIAGVIGLGAAIDYLQQVGLPAIQAYETELLAYATNALQVVPGLRLIGTAKNKVSILSFVLEKVHPHDIGTILDREGIAVRSGHHCAMPVMERFHIPATTRASLVFYNTRREVDTLVVALIKVGELFKS